MAITEKQKQAVFDVLKAATHKFAVKNKYIKEKEKAVKVDPELQKIADLIGKLGGCSSDEFRELFSLVLKKTSGLELPPATILEADSEGLIAVKYAVVMLVGNHNNHNYPYDKEKVPILLHRPESDMTKAHGMTATFFEGNWLPIEFEVDVKPATEDEIWQFVNEAAKKTAQATELFGKIIGSK